MPRPSAKRSAKLNGRSSRSGRLSSDDDDYRVHPLVLAVLQAVQRATADRRPPYYVSVEGLALADYPERIDAAVMLAVLSGWLVAGGKPAHPQILRPFE